MRHMDSRSVERHQTSRETVEARIHAAGTYTEVVLRSATAVNLKTGMVLGMVHA